MTARTPLFADIYAGDVVRYVGDAPALVGKRGTVDSITPRGKLARVIVEVNGCAVLRRVKRENLMRVGGG